MRTKLRSKSRRIAQSDPAWEAAKAARRNIGHDEAVQESFFLQKQFRDQWSDRMAASPVDLNEVLRTLTRLKIKFVLTGTHGIGGWTGRPRDTFDVDILVKAGRSHARTVKAIQALYPTLEVRPFTGVTGFFMPGEKQSVLDVLYPHRADLEDTLTDALWAENKNAGVRYQIPSLECALANKYGAMLDLVRPYLKRQQDLIDFAWMVTHSLDSGQQPIDLQRLAILGEKVWPGGGGKEIAQLVRTVKDEKAIDIHLLGK